MTSGLWAQHATTAPSCFYFSTGNRTPATRVKGADPCHWTIENNEPPVGFEPTIYRLEVCRLSHWATGAVKIFRENQKTLGGDRTHNLLLRRQSPYPFGHEGSWFLIGDLLSFLG